MFVIDVEIDPVELNWILFLRTADGGADNVSDSIVRFEEKLSINGGLYLAACSICAYPSWASGHGETPFSYPFFGRLPGKFPKTVRNGQKREGIRTQTLLGGF